MLTYADLQCTNPRNVILLLQDALVSSWKASRQSGDAPHIAALSHGLELLSEVAFDFAEGRKGYFGDTGNAMRLSLLTQTRALKRLTPDDRLKVLSAINYFQEHLAALCRKDVKRERRRVAGLREDRRKGPVKGRSDCAFTSAQA
ncbi:hypothetical protein [Brucella sp.]|uniref:hypothetical protein n=1 Tax=Brucella sp. TaxID=52132 RepID=UPI0028ACE7D5|nr:hypothetical protein [Brucella sp.]